jgi:hypothetical protein
MKKIAILTTITLACGMHARMYVPEGATAAQQQKAVQTERMLQQGNVNAASNVNSLDVVNYGNVPTTVSTSGSTTSQSSYTQNIGTGSPAFSQSGFFQKSLSIR